MTSADWDQVKRLFTEALARPPHARRIWLNTACDGNTVLFHEVAELLELHATDDLFLVPPDHLDSSTMESVLDRDLSLGTGGDIARLGPLPRPGTLLAHRYRLLDRVAAGASGAVYRATDEVVRETVAVKVLRRGQHRESPSFRLEVATLRRARLPGIVEILDDNEEQGHAFIVMQWLDGRPFPGDHGPAWDELREPALSLAEGLERLHWADVLHRDLKPANVLVDGDGRATITDLGIALETRWEEGRSIPVAGTPNYLAPELWSGARPDARSDLYALGVMLFQALTGRRPHACSSLEALRHARLNEPAPSIAELAPDVPLHVARVIDELLDRNPAARPSSAAEVATRLRGRPPVSLPPPAAGEDAAYTRDELAGLFEGPELVQHLPSDAATELWLRTAGDAERVRSELDTWRRAGLARREGPRFVIDRTAIARLARLRTDGSAVRQKSPEALRDDALALAARLSADEVAFQGNELIDEIHGALSALRAERDARHDAFCDLLHALVSAELVQVNRSAVDRLLYTFQRFPLGSQRYRDLARIAESAHAMLLGDKRRATEPLRFEAVHPRDEELRIRVLGHHLFIVDKEAHAEFLLEVIRTMRGPAETSPGLRDWVNFRLAWRHYAAGRFERAARLHLRSVRPGELNHANCDKRANAASALLEAGEFGAAAELAAIVRADAAELRDSNSEVRAIWIERSSRYRRGDALHPDHELLAALQRIEEPRVVAMLAMTEAGIAWRAGEFADALRAAALSEDAARRATFPSIHLLAQGLHRWLSEPSIEQPAYEWEPSFLATFRPAGVALQVAAFRAAVDSTCRTELRAIGTELARSIPRDRWRLRREILSVDESFRLMSEPPLDPMDG